MHLLMRSAVCSAWEKTVVDRPPRAGHKLGLAFRETKHTIDNIQRLARLFNRVPGDLLAMGSFIVPQPTPCRACAYR